MKERPGDQRVSDDPKAPTLEPLAYTILRVVWGDARAAELWESWTEAQRGDVIELADDAFLPILRGLADDIVTWNERNYGRLGR